MSDQVPTDFEALRQSLRVMDITDEPAWLAAARWEVAAGYSKLASPKHKVRMRDIYATLCSDGYESDGRSRTIAVLAEYPTPKSVEIAGLVRVVFGREMKTEADLPPLDAMHFIAPDAEWPHRKRGLSDNEVAELGRFTVCDNFRLPAMRAAGIDGAVTHLLFAEAKRLAGARGANTIYSIMPPPASEMVLKSGIDLAEIPSHLREDNADAVKVFDAFSVYWRRMTPRLYVMTEGVGHLVPLFEESGIASDTILADSEKVRQRYGRNVTALERRIPLALLPEVEHDVAAIIRVANEHAIPLYPFSTGKNWGLGSKLPVVDDCVLVDLSRMNQIVAVDEDYAYAILEPGVTQLQLARHLRDHHPSLTMNFTGSFAHTGVVGNVLERGDGGHARVDDLLGVKGILGNGKPFAVGGIWENVGSTRPSHVQRFAAGPDLCGMFCQSNFGIVTQLAFKLIRKPESRYILWGAAGDEQLEAIVDTLERFTGEGLIRRGSVNIGYANRFVQAQQTMVGGREPPIEWNFYALVHGTHTVAKAIADEVLVGIKPLTTDRGAFRIGREDGDHDPIESLPAFLLPLVSPLLGLPDGNTIKMIYQLTNTTLPADERELDADQTPFGMKTCIPIVPPQSMHARAAVDIVNDVRRKHGMNVKISFFGDGRTLITIHFRSDNAEQVKRATACEAELWDQLIAAGFPPYRASIDQMSRLIELRPEFFNLVAQLKSTLDPNNIISPGRYCPLRGNA